MTEPTTKREAEEMIQKQEQHARLCERAAGRESRRGYSDLALEKQRSAHRAMTEAARLRALLPTLPE